MSKLKPLLAPGLLVVLSIGVASCGGSGKQSASKPDSQTSSTVPAHTVSTVAAGTRPTDRPGPKDSDDGDSDANSDDDRVILDYGHAANASEARAVTAVVKRYYAAAAADDGATACGLIYSLFEEEIPEEYGTSELALGSESGKTCAAIMTNIFKQKRRLLSADAASLVITGVRIQEKRGYALLRFATTPEPRRILVHRERNTWKVDALLDIGMP